MSKVIKSAFILHSYPMLFGPECIPELNEKESFYCLIPKEELALLYGVKWPIVIDHVDETIKSNVKGFAVSEIISESFLYCPKIEIDKSLCTIQEIKNFRQWNETSTCYTALHLTIEEPYEFIDETGVLGYPGKPYLIKYHIINIQPLHLAIVKYGRTGYKGILRNPIDRVVKNSIAKYTNSDIIQSNNSEILVLNNRYEEIENMKTKDKESVAENEVEESVDENSSSNVESPTVDNALGDSIVAGLQPMMDAIAALSMKIDDLIAMETTEDEPVAANKLAAKKKVSKEVKNSASKTEEVGLEEYDDEDDEDESEEADDDSNDENVVENNISDSIQKSVEKALNNALLKVGGVKNNSVKEETVDPYESFANRYKN
jgi:hypothetical protein